MSKKLFWTIYFLLFILFLLPTANYLVAGFPDFLEREDVSSKLWFSAHILSGLIVYIIAPFQFSAPPKKGESGRHKLLGRVFIVASLSCIVTLYLDILPTTLCQSCQLSQYIATTLWLIFILLAFWCIRYRKIELHKRFMVSGFICAAYFVTVRVVSLTLMGFFGWITPNEHMALLVSDIFIWLVPLLISWTIWLRRDYFTRKTSMVTQTHTKPQALRK